MVDAELPIPMGTGIVICWRLAAHIAKAVALFNHCFVLLNSNAVTVFNPAFSIFF
jgi:hypothetical protein